MDYTTKTPGEIAHEILVLTEKYSNLSDELGSLLKLKNVNWSLIRVTVTSDKQADKNWSKTDAGTREEEIELELKKIKMTL